MKTALTMKARKQVLIPLRKLELKANDINYLYLLIAFDMQVQVTRLTLTWDQAQFLRFSYILSNDKAKRKLYLISG